MKYLYFIALFVGLTLSGCTILAVGENESQCEQEGCDYSRAGVCDNMIDIYKNRATLKNRKVKEHWITEDEDPFIENK